MTTEAKQLRAALKLLLGECNWECEGHTPGTLAAVKALGAAEGARKHGYPIGTQFTVRRGSGKRSRTDLCTVVDLLTTTDAKGEVVSLRYVATHPFLGQDVAERDVCEVTIARGLVRVGLAGGE